MELIRDTRKDVQAPRCVTGFKDVSWNRLLSLEVKDCVKTPQEKMH